MSTRLKISDSIVLNADEIVAMENGLNFFVKVFTSITTFNSNSEGSNVFGILTSNPDALIAAINKALTSAPSGRVIEVPSSPNYNISGLTFGTA